MRNELEMPGGIACWVMAALFALGFLVLAVKLEHVQLDGAAGADEKLQGQSVRCVRTAGVRGRILDRHGRVLAANRPSVAIAYQAETFERRNRDVMAVEIHGMVQYAGRLLGLESKLTEEAVARHLQQRLARPLVVWDDVDEAVLARFAEHALELPGFALVEELRRVYPEGTLAAHLLGYVGAERVTVPAGDGRVHFTDYEMRGRSGLEYYYDSYLRGVPGETSVLVDACGFARRTWEVQPGGRGFDLQLTIDAGLQAVVEEQLRGYKGACAVIDPQDGAVLALASAPSFDPNGLLPAYDPNGFRPVLAVGRYTGLVDDPRKPLLNRAVGESYAPGSTFKPITALAGLIVGVPPDAAYECTGAYYLGKMRIRCARTWGHGPLDLRHALKESCNAYFCHLGMEAGTNVLATVARAFGLGAPTGIDFPQDVRGVVPDDGWKRETYRTPWYPGDLAQMAMGQGMLLVTPLQMARVAGALGTGALVTPYLKDDMATEPRPLPFGRRDLDIVRDGMRMVVDGGTGRRGGTGVDAFVIGKTGTAEVGRGATRRKNTWFIAYATGTPESRPEARHRALAIAMVIENGESGGGTTAPKVSAVLRAAFNDPNRKGDDDVE
ncbi:MAG: penicillin-binding transpeptidase domain-containing protein [Kiritimatiellia bacterium]